MKSELDKAFEEAYDKASNTNTKLPPDVMLQLYAYYKQATKGNSPYFHKPSGEEELKNAFKVNAWLQLKHISEEEAKKAYINLVKTHLK